MPETSAASYVLDILAGGSEGNVLMTALAHLLHFSPSHFFQLLLCANTKHSNDADRVPSETNYHCESFAKHPAQKHAAGSDTR